MVKTYAKIYIELPRNGGAPFAPDVALTETEFARAISNGANLITHLNEFLWTDWRWVYDWHEERGMYHATGPVPTNWYFGLAVRGSDHLPTERMVMVAGMLPPDHLLPEQAYVYMEVESDRYYTVGASDPRDAGDHMWGGNDGFFSANVSHNGTTDFPVTSIKVYTDFGANPVFWTNKRVCTEREG